MSYCVGIARHIRAIAGRLVRIKGDVWRADLEKAARLLELAASYAEGCDFYNARTYFEESRDLMSSLKENLERARRGLGALDVEFVGALDLLMGELDKVVEEMEGLYNLIRTLAPA